ncbi:MAG: acetate kinase, partial [Planctomycetes bacterium]|nr:acetate kinase [Planctomycetota bacterium]
MKTLVLNCGSSSLKYQLIDTANDTLIAKGLVEKIGTSKALFIYKPHDKPEFRDVLEVKDHAVALQSVLKAISDPVRGVIRTPSEIEAIGHRVVHGGEEYSASVVIDDQVISKIKACIAFAPLHNPPNLMGIEACRKVMPEVPQVAVFDTAFHQKMPKQAFLYALPYSMYEKHGIRRYGFHGTSHAYVVQKAAEMLGKDYRKNFKAITCHLGNGASMAAIKDGVSVDTSMGFTPLEGLVMGTRCGDLDPAIIPYIMQKEELGASEVESILNKQSGLKGICRTSNDMREIREEAEGGSALHQLAIDVFCYRVKKYIGAYTAVLNGVDAIIFTGGIGENDVKMRAQTLEGLEALGIVCSPELNTKGEAGVISTGKVKVMIVPTDEEMAIAMQTRDILQQKIEKVRKERDRKAVVEQLAAVSGPQRTQ